MIEKKSQFELNTWNFSEKGSLFDIVQNEYLIDSKNNSDQCFGPINPSKSEIEKYKNCSQCSNAFINKNFIIYQNFPLCFDCWEQLKHVIFINNYQEINKKEQEFYQIYRNSMDSISKICQNSSNKLHHIKLLNKELNFGNELVIDFNNFQISNLSAISIVIFKLIHLDPELIFQKYFDTELITIKNLKKNSNQNSNFGSFEIKSPYAHLSLDLEIFRSDNNLKILIQYSGKAIINFVEEFHYILTTIFTTEISRFRHNIELAQLYLKCGNIKEAQDLIHEMSLNMDSEQADQLDTYIYQYYTNLENIYFNLNIIVCPFCLTQTTNSESFHSHIEKNHSN